MRVAAVKVDSYDYQTVEKGLGEALSLLGGLGKFVNPGEIVLIKPNMLEGLPPENAVTTHPEVVRVMLKI